MIGRYYGRVPDCLNVPFSRSSLASAPTPGGQKPPKLLFGAINWTWDRLLNRLRFTGSASDACSPTIMEDARDARAPEKANPNTSSAALPPTTTSTTTGGSDAQGPLPLPRLGHELPFVAPSSYLRPATRAMADKAPSPLDKEQMQGLVSNIQFLRDTGAFEGRPLHRPSPPQAAMRGPGPACSPDATTHDTILTRCRA